MRYLFGLLLGLLYFQYAIGYEPKHTFTLQEEGSDHSGYFYLTYSGHAFEVPLEIGYPQAVEYLDDAYLPTSSPENALNYSVHVILLDEQSENVESSTDLESDGDFHYSIRDPNLAVAGIGQADIDSYPYEIGSVDLENGGIGFINGINNLEEESKEHALRISRYAQGVKILGVYNATHSFFLDILECILGHCRIPIPPSRMLKNHWDHFISTRGPEAKFLQICHSSGTIYVYNALASSPKEVRERIIVLAISPGAVIPKKLCYEAYNYASKRDIIPHLDALGKIRYGDQLIMLDPHRDAAHFDHAFDSPTFQDIILFHITNYLKQIGYIE